jgi:hypothetical protein
MESQKHNNVRYARPLFLSGLVIIATALISALLKAKPIATVVLVLVGLLLLTIALAIALAHTSRTNQKLTVRKNAADNPADFTSLVEFLAYFVFIK